MAERSKVVATMSSVTQSIIAAEDRRKAVRLAWDMYPGWESESVDGVAVVGRCEVCRKAILDGDKFASDPEGDILYCRKCAAELPPAEGGWDDA